MKLVSRDLLLNTFCALYLFVYCRFSFKEWSLFFADGAGRRFGVGVGGFLGCSSLAVNKQSIFIDPLRIKLATTDHLPLPLITM